MRAAHEQRVSELLAANNDAVARRRDAERMCTGLKAAIDAVAQTVGAGAQRLAEAEAERERLKVALAALVHAISISTSSYQRDLLTSIAFESARILVVPLPDKDEK
jgi:hypothetical protein